MQLAKLTSAEEIVFCLWL